MRSVLKEASGRVPGRFWDGFRRVWGGFGMDFGRILKRFLELFGGFGGQAMIRATKGKSSRPNHMCSHLDALQGMPPVAFRRLAGTFHSVAQLASIYVALQCV